MTPYQAGVLRALIKKHVQAEVDASWAGSKHPADADHARAKAKKAKDLLFKKIREYTDETRQPSCIPVPHEGLE